MTSLPLSRNPMMSSFDEFEQTWVSDAPPEHLPFYGCWGDPDTIFVGGPATALPADQLVPTMVLPTAP